MNLLWFNLATDVDDPILGFATRWIQKMAERVDFVYVITMRVGRYEFPENVRVYSVGKEKGYSKPRRAVEFYKYLYRILRGKRIDVCFSHMIPIFTVMAAPVLKFNKIPIVTWYAHPSLTWTLKLAHHLSNRMVASVSTAYPYKRDKLVVVGQGIDTDLFHPDDTKPDQPPLLLCVGRLSPVKDHPTLIRAAALLRERWPKPFRVVILGGPARPADRDYMRFLQNLIQELNLQDLVSLHPPVPMRDLPTWYRRCTVHVNLTPTGSGDKVAWEAMACGRPCVVANEGFRETLGIYAENLLFEHGNPESLAERLLWVLSLEEREREIVGAYLREQVVKFHSLERLVERLVALFRDIKEA